MAAYQGDRIPGDDITIARKLYGCRVNGISSIGTANLVVSANIISFRRLLSAHFCKQGSQLVFVHSISSHDSADYGIRE
ncbi:hypothetical protein C3731_19060 [Brucella oryzae]|uniref:Uncharacterized protein n=1 Tax=Brucella oryzae TaxID=335286 RepID=A0A2S7IVB9_9HYPH|nr:hypothetical protein [Brucella oryzae]MBR7654433.1 hypothetical protein [Brucella oryzae]PQA71967.1 hypothetical protein C3731_19060 [Brucella oryzae]